MKFTVPAFFLGTALGVAGTWFALQPTATTTKATKTAAATASVSADQAEITRLRALVAAQTAERQVLELELGKAEKGLKEKKDEPKDDGIGGMMAKMLEGDKISKIMEAQAKGERRSKVERLSARLKLTPEQRASLEQFLEKQDKANIAQMEAMQKSPLMKKMFSGQELTEDEQKEMEKMGKGLGPGAGSGGLNDWIKANLEPEQSADYELYQKERKTAQAEASAAQKLTQLSNVVDLSEEQKDKAYKNFYEQAMKGPSLDDVSGFAGGPPGGGEGGVIVATGEVQNGEINQPQEDGLEKVLTPEQLETYKKHQAEQQKAQEEMMKAIGIPNFGKPKGGKK